MTRLARTLHLSQTAMLLLALLPVSQAAGAAPKARTDTEKPRYRLVALPVDVDEGLRLNNRGDVAGISFAMGEKGPASSPAAVLYRNGRLTKIGPGRVLALNDAGQVLVAPSYYGHEPFDPYLWKDGQRTLLPEGFRPNGLSNRGDVVGPLDGKPVLWSENVVSEIYNLPEPGCAARLANNQGDVVLIGTKHYLWKDGKAQTLEVSPGQAFWPEIILDNGDMAGYSISEDRPIVRRGGKIERLPMLEGTELAWAKGLNARGEAVGYAERPWPDLTDRRKGPQAVAELIRPVLWKDGKAYDLNDLVADKAGWHLLTAECINDRGEIVGSGTRNDEEQAVLLTPLDDKLPAARPAGR